MIGTSSLVEIVRDRADKTPDASAYTFLSGTPETLTFLQLYQRARAVGERLRQLGAEGERALLLYPPGTEYIVAFVGCLLGGTVAVTAYPPRMNRNVQRLEKIVEDAQPRVVLTNETVFRQQQQWRDESSSLAKIDWVITDDLIAPQDAGWTDFHADADTMAFLQYTSGSTSRPKGVMVSHGNILHNQALMREMCRHDQNTVILSWQPLFHDMGLVGVVLASLYNGVPCYLMSPVDFLKRPRSWLEAISRYGATFSGAPDFGFRLCVDRIPPAERAGLDLSSWKVAFNGAEPVRAETVSAFIDAFGPCGFRPEAMFPCYGLAEHTLFVAGGFSHKGKSFSRSSIEEHQPKPAINERSLSLVNCGRPAPACEIAIVDPSTLKPSRDGQIGEIWLAGGSVAQGYWKQPEATERDFHARLENGRGPFLRTGDLGFLDANNLYVTGRLKDLIIIHGRNLIPQDIEETVERCDPAIRTGHVAAVSVDDGLTERLVLVVEVRRESRRSVDLSTLIENVRRAVANEYAVSVSAVAVVGPGKLPKTSSGKTQRAKISRDFLDGNLNELMMWRSEQTLDPPPTPARRVKKWSASQVEEWLVQRLAVHVKVPAHQLDHDRSISFYGVDSMAAVTLGCEIEEAFAIEWNSDLLFTGDQSLRELSVHIAAAAAQPAILLPRIRASETDGLILEGVPNNKPEPNGKPQTSFLSVSQAESPAQFLATVNSGVCEPNGTRSPASAKPTPPLGARKNGEHPFRTSVNPELGRVLAQMAMDKTFVRGEGCWLWDENGRRYLDFLAQYGALPFGFNPPRIWAALEAVRQSAEPSFTQPSYLNAAGELAGRLLEAAPPGMAYVTFANSGAEAVEAAIKMARSTTGRHGILAANNGFHGKTLGALSATDKEKYQRHFGAPVPGFEYVPYGNLEALRKMLSTRKFAGFIVEPVQGEGGIVEPPVGYLRSARKACREAGTLFIADEIQTGIGRTGAMFVCCELGITPDIMTVAKALGGGLVPIGACVATSAAYNEYFALKHTSTFAGNTLACRAGLATLNWLEENDHALLKDVAENGRRLKDGLLELQRRYPTVIAEIRGRGYLLGLRFGLNRYSVEDGLLGYLGEQDEFTFLVVGHLLHFEGVRVGCTLNQGGILRIEPPLTATWKECQVFLSALERVLVILEKRDTAQLTAQISGLRFPDRPASPNGNRPNTRAYEPKRGRIAEPQVGDGRFAFLVHPLAWKDYGDLDRTLTALTNDQLATLSSAMADNFDPFVIGQTRVVGRNGKAAFGEFILVPRRAEELKSMPQAQALDEIHKGVALGAKRGAKIIGLGAYTSVVTRGGLSLKGLPVPALTTGNSYTAVAARDTIRLAASEKGWALPNRSVAILGAAGSIGDATAILMSCDIGRLVLLGNPAHPDESRQRLLQVAGRIVWARRQSDEGPQPLPGSVASWARELDFNVPARPDRATLARLGEELIRRSGSVVVSVDAAGMLPEVDLIVSCTSSTEHIVREEWLRSRVVVCDVSRPSNIAGDVGLDRPDVMILNGGVVRMPGNASLGINASLGHGLSYACMAETMMLAMEKRYEDTSLGFDLEPSRVIEMERLANQLGFEAVLDHKARSEGGEFCEVPREELPRELAKAASFIAVGT